MEHFDDRNIITAPMRALVGSKRSWVVVLLALLLSGVVLGLDPTPTSSSSSSSNLPDSAESAIASRKLADLAGADKAPAVVVWSRSSKLTPQDLAAANELRATLAKELDTDVPGPIPSTSGTVALIAVPVSSSLDNDANTKVVDQIRDAAKAAAPDGVTSQVTGAPAIQADLGAVFSGADVRLLIATASVVALLLLITYRSPTLWLVPLLVVGIADRVAAVTVDAASATFNFAIDGSTTGITSVLVFGAGTNYALLLIARYREELRHVADRREAMRRAVGAAAPAILSSSGTVVLALLSLLLANAPFVSRIGLAGAVGIVIAVIFALFVLPSAMVLPGRWLFWPFVPRVDATEGQPTGWWHRVGAAVTARPVPVAIASTVALLLMSLGAIGIRTGLAQDQQFLDTPESITAQQTLAKAFPAGTSSPTTIAASPTDAERVAEVAKGVDGVQSATVIARSPDVAEVDVVLTASPGSSDALATVGDLRDALKTADVEALVGGQDAKTLDERSTARSDRLLVVPLVLVIVIVMLLLLLRSVVAAALLVTTTVLSYFSALGVGWLLFDHIFGWNAMDVSTPLLAFIFLVALGVDYNIFLTARAREEMRRSGDATGSIVAALSATGGVITSAGILLAAVFAVLGVLPLVLLAQLGVIVGFGVLLDTTVVRSVLTPALVAITGRRFWWPSPLSRS